MIFWIFYMCCNTIPAKGTSTIDHFIGNRHRRKTNLTLFSILILSRNFTNFLYNLFLKSVMRINFNVLILIWNLIEYNFFRFFEILKNINNLMQVKAFIWNSKFFKSSTKTTLYYLRSNHPVILFVTIDLNLVFLWIEL